MMRRHTLALAAALACALPALAQNYPQPTPAMQAIIDKDTSRYFGDAPTDAGPYATDVSSALEPAAIDHALRKVADWQLARARPHFDRIWTSAVMYSGFMAASAATGDPKYRDAMAEMAQHFDFQLRSRLPNADDQAIGQTYLELYFQQKRPSLLGPTRAELDDLLPLATLKPNDARIPWWWCDALFMAPATWMGLSRATGDAKYADFAKHELWATTAYLYDPAEHLFYRDSRFFQRRGPNGEKVFWSRGNGWVFAGLTRMLDALPANDPDRPRIVALYKEMAVRIAAIQLPDGYWAPSLLADPKTALPETSGTAFYVYGLAWGIRNGTLPRAQYAPAVRNGWAALVKAVHPDGKLGYVQPVSDRPDNVGYDDTQFYGVGAFLLAGTAVADLKLQ